MIVVERSGGAGWWSSVVERAGAPRAAFAVRPVEHNGLAFPMNIAAGVPTTYCRVERLRRAWWQ
jgi:hypothetical protein